VFTQSDGALRLHQLLPHNSRLVMVADAAHHRVYPFYGHGLVNDLTTDYLLTGRLPETDITCDNSPTPSRQYDHAVRSAVS
jgi:TAP-like protein